ncbi:hypothetical protein X759_03275 [Mesorhizobium sp. LSHC420B00]|uniref:hypothetical protein n=1 Tax=unclassified Mesorhizobium TaxID=325217 RepID=UPI0003CEFD0F|nr:hypothetical protein [Mesorhizobium sp. LSHC420B00]ESX83342.1 hypothetical protein X759_03275 [Mesorhizobium sp. LSHC420B00]
MARSHVERLGEFREILVATRREGVRNVHHTRDAMRASGFQIGDGDGSSYGAEMKVLQEEIEAVDRAIEDEKRLALAIEGAAQPRRPTKPRIVKGT